MNILKKLLTLFFMCFLLNTNVFSQQSQTYQQADLMGKDWYFYSGGNHDFVMRFSNTEMIDISYLGQTNKSYYLSNNIETTFDHTKVGNVSSGRYIIVLWSIVKSQIDVYEIMRLDAHALQLKYIGDATYGGVISNWRSPKTDWVESYSGYDNPYDDGDEHQGGGPFTDD